MALHPYSTVRRSSEAAKRGGEIHLVSLVPAWTLLEGPGAPHKRREGGIRYIYMTAHTLGWEFPDMDQYEQRTRVGKACRESRPIGKGAKPPAGILSKKDRPKRALTRHQRFMSQEMSCGPITQAGATGRLWRR